MSAPRGPARPLGRDPTYANEVAELSKKLLAHMKRTEDSQTKAFEAALATK